MPAGTQLSHCYNLTGHSLDMRIKLISLTYVPRCKKLVLEHSNQLQECRLERKG